MNTKTDETLNKLISIIGGVGKTAVAIGIKSPTLYCWRRHGIPADRAKQIEMLTDGQIMPYDIRPDLWPYRDFSFFRGTPKSDDGPESESPTKESA